MKIIYKLNEQQIKELHGLYKKEWWTKERSLQQTKRCVEGSQINIGILNDNGQLIAYARVLTDFIFKVLIFDVIVCENHRGQGLGDTLIEKVKTHELLVGVTSFELYCLPEMMEFYEKHGFLNENGVKLMKYPTFTDG